MFNSLVSTQNPKYQLWNCSNNIGSSKITKIGLEDDCADIQYFLLNNSSGTSILVYLPTNPPAGKTITFRTTSINANSGTGINIYDSSNSSKTSLAFLGSNQTTTLIYIPDNGVKELSNNALSSCWFALHGTKVGTAQATNTAGDNSFVASGVQNNTTGTGSFIGGGINNNIQQGGYQSVIVGGVNNSLQQRYSFIGGGDGNTTAGTYSTICGGAYNTTFSTYSTIVGGVGHRADGNYTFIGGGAYGSTRGTTGRHAFPACYAPVSFTAGTSQASLLIVAKNTTDATPTQATSTNSTPDYNNILTMTGAQAYYVRGSVVAYQNATNNAKQWSFECLIKNDSSYVTSLVGTPIITSSFADAGASSWDLSVTADTTYYGLNVTVTGDSTGDQIRFVCRLDTVESAFEL